MMSKPWKWKFMRKNLKLLVAVLMFGCMVKKNFLRRIQYSLEKNTIFFINKNTIY